MGNTAASKATALNNTLLDFIIFSFGFWQISNATKLVKPNEKPKEDPTKPQFYNIIYKLTTFFKKIIEKKSLTMKSTSRQRKAMLTFIVVRKKAPRFHKRFYINAVMAFSRDGAYFEAR